MDRFAGTGHHQSARFRRNWHVLRDLDHESQMPAIISDTGPIPTGAPLGASLRSVLAGAARITNVKITEKTPVPFSSPGLVFRLGLGSGGPIITVECVVELDWTFDSVTEL
jgi:hypothetical protein